MSGDTRQRILEAALPVFADQGFAGASTRALAAAAGVNIATLAYHFQDKQGLYDAVVDSIYLDLLALDLPPIQALGPRPADRVHALVALLYGQARKNAAGIRLLLRHVMESGGSPERVRAHWELTALQQAAGLLAALGLDPARDHRLALLSLNHLIARFAVTDAEHLRPFLDGQGGPPRDPHEAVARHLGDLACTLLGLEPA